MGSMRKLLILCIPLILLGLGCREPRVTQEINLNIATPPSPPALREVPAATFFPIKTGERVVVSGLTLEAISITALTNQGCQGGPIGCPDSIELQVTGVGVAPQSLTLVVLGGSTQTASSERTVFGHRIVLSEITADSATLGIFLAPAPLIPPSPPSSR